MNDNLVHFPWIYFYEFQEKCVCITLFCKYSLPHNKKTWNFLKKTLWSLFMDGVQPPQGYRATTRRQFTFLPLNSQKFLVVIQNHVLKIQKTWFNEFMCNMTLILNWLLVLCDVIVQGCYFSRIVSHLILPDFKGYLCYKILFAIK